MRATIPDHPRAQTTVRTGTFPRASARILIGMFLVWSALLVALDQATKLWAQARFAAHGEELPLALGFSFTYTRNSGAAFGMLRNLSIPIGPFVLDGTLVLGLLSAAVSVGLIGYLWRRGRSLDALTYASLSIVLAGAVGNAIDRLRLGYVIDFIHFQVGSFDFPVFNVADSCVVVGAALLLIHSFGSDAERRAHERDERSASFEPRDADGDSGFEEAERR